jgi:two-component system LytT family response regulator
VLVVDDERPARRKVRRLLEADPDIGAIHEAPDGETAIRLVREERPDLVFLDIQMPGLDGLSVVETLGPEAMPHVVFVTAYDAHAVQAFDLHAVDYLLKPFDPPRFGRALARAKQALASDRSSDDAALLGRLLAQAREDRGAPLDRLLVEAGEKTLLLSLADVDRLESERNYVLLHVGAVTYRVRAVLADLEGRLDGRRFARVSRGTIVNLDRVASLESIGHGDYQIRMKAGGTVRLSRRYLDRVDRLREGR